MDCQVIVNFINRLSVQSVLYYFDSFHKITTIFWDFIVFVQLI